jgi:hypothetical protein
MAASEPSKTATSAPVETDKPKNVDVTDVFYKGGPLGGQHRRVVGDLENEDQRHGGSYRLEHDDNGAASYVWDADPDRRVPHAIDGDEASAALGDGAKALADETAGVRTDGPSISPAVVVEGSGSSKESAAERRDAAKVGSARPATAKTSK